MTDGERRARRQRSPVTVVALLLLLVTVALVARFVLTGDDPGCDRRPTGDLASEAELREALEGCGFTAAAADDVSSLPCARSTGIVDVGRSMPLGEAIDVSFGGMPPRAGESFTFVLVDGGVVLRGSLDGTVVSQYALSGSGTAWVPGGMQRCDV